MVGSRYRAQQRDHRGHDRRGDQGDTSGEDTDGSEQPESP